MSRAEIRVGKRIKQRREAMGWTQIQLARTAGIDPSLISRYEAGSRRLNETDLWKITGALGWSPEKLYATESNVAEVALAETRRIPLLDYVQAGKWTEVQATRVDADDHEMVLVSLECPPSSFMMEIRGDSMLPRFEPGDRVIIVPMLAPKPGDFVVATDESGDATFKKYRDLGVNQQGLQVFELVALNPDYAPMRSDRQQITIVGTMIEHRHYRPHR